MGSELNNRVIIHVGAPKTGSTYLQKRLRIAPDILRAAGLHVPVLPIVERMAGNAKILATALLGRPTDSFARAFPDINVSDLAPQKIVDDLLAGWRRDREVVVLSAENFRASHAERLRDLLPSDCRVDVVLYVRRQDNWLESYFNQLTKTNDIACDFEAFCDLIFKSTDDRWGHPNWFENYQAWHATFGRCRVVIYEDAKSDMFGSFLSAAGFPDMPALPDIAPTQVSFGHSQLAYLLSLDPALSFKEFQHYRHACVQVAQKRAKLKPISFLSPVARRHIYESFAPSNAALAKVLGRADQPLFSAPSEQIQNYVFLNDFYQSTDYIAFEKECVKFMVQNA